MKYLIAFVALMVLLGGVAYADTSNDEPEQILLVKGKAHGKILDEIPQLDIKVVKGHKKDQTEAKWAEVNFMMEAFDVPNDPLYPQQWGYPMVDAPLAWNVPLEGDITVAVLDTGIDLDHEDLVGKMVSHYSSVYLVRPEPPVQPIEAVDDPNGHGTHCAGIVSAATNNNIGVAGTAPTINLMIVQVLNKYGEGGLDWICRGIVWAVDHGADVLSMSFGSRTESLATTEAINYALEHGVICVAAAGNYGSSTLVYPASLNGVISVAATNSSDYRASFSTYGSWVDVAAPGENILSTWNDGGYIAKSGTSMACPMVAGIAGMLLAEGVTDIEFRLESTSENQTRYGISSGRVNAYYALMNITSQPPEPPEPPPTTPPPTTEPPKTKKEPPAWGKGGKPK